MRPYVVKSHILTTRRKQNCAMVVFAGSLTVSTAVFATKNTSRRVWNFCRASLCSDGEKLVVLTLTKAWMGERRVGVGAFCSLMLIECTYELADALLCCKKGARIFGQIQQRCSNCGRTSRHQGVLVGEDHRVRSHSNQPIFTWLSVQHMALQQGRTQCLTARHQGVQVAG